ncbi:hypothetical protein, partial [Streptococcus pneumoniae]|uniref:hypothetical protein n=1 Tax=Streptococcus pneumoniae TaxID=1313 RepID=UPI001E3E35A7
VITTGIISTTFASPSPAEASTDAGLTASAPGASVYYVKLKSMAAKWINDRLSALIRLLSPRLTMA